MLLALRLGLITLVAMIASIALHWEGMIALGIFWHQTPGPWAAIFPAPIGVLCLLPTALAAWPTRDRTELWTLASYATIAQLALIVQARLELGLTGIKWSFILDVVATIIFVPAMVTAEWSYSRRRVRLGVGALGVAGCVALANILMSSLLP